MNEFQIDGMEPWLAGLQDHRCASGQKGSLLDLPNAGKVRDNDWIFESILYYNITNMHRKVEHELT